MDLESDGEIDEYCPALLMANGEPNTDHSHCQCWWDGDACCRCKASAISETQMREQGMIE